MRERLSTSRTGAAPSTGTLKSRLPSPSSAATATNFPSGDHDGASRTSSDAAKGRTLAPSAFITYRPFRPCRRMEKHINRPSGDTAGGAITPPSLLRHNSTVSPPSDFHKLCAPPFDERNTTYCGPNRGATARVTGSGKRRTADSSTIWLEMGSVQSSPTELATDATSRVARFHRRAALERAPPAEHLVQNRSVGEDVRPMVYLLRPHLLRRHIPDRAHHHPRRCTKRLSRSFVVQAGHRAIHWVPERRLQLCQPEVENLDASVFGDEEVLWLQVAMHDSLIVRGGQTARNLQGIIDHTAWRQRRAAQPITQCFAIEEFRNDVRRAPIFRRSRTDVIDRQDIRMIESPGRAGLLLEAMQPILIV